MDKQNIFFEENIKKLEKLTINPFSEEEIHEFDKLMELRQIILIKSNIPKFYV